MKKIFTVLALMALVMSSCSKEERPGNGSAPETKAEITFGVQGVGLSASTKAYTESTASILQTNGFKVAGVTSGNATMFNAVASFASSKFSPAGGPYYYPAAGTTMSFYAAYPQTTVIGISSGAASLEYVSDAETDLITSKRTGVGASSSSVALTFDHILSLVKFKAAGTDANVIYKISSISVSGDYGGTYTYSSDSWAFTQESAATKKADFPFYSGTLPLSGTTDVPGQQTHLPDIISVTVEWKTYALDGTTEIASYTDTESLSTALAKGKETTITLKLPNSSAQGIAFSVTVNPWVAENRDLNF